MDQYVLHISSWYPNVRHPSLGNFVRRHVGAVNSYVPSIVLHPVALEGLNEMEFVMNEQASFPEAYVYYPQIQGESKLVFWKKWKALGKAYEFGLRRILETKGKPSLVHHHVAYPHGYFASKIARKLSIPLIASEHWTGYTKEDDDFKAANPLQKMITKRFYKRTRAVLPVSEHLGNSLKDHGLINEFEVVPNVVNTDLFKASLAETGKHRFLHVSNLRNRQKNLEGILRTFGKLEADFQLTLIGEEVNEDLDDMLKEYALEHKVKILLKLSEEEVAEQMRSHDTLVLFSYFENLPCVLIEACSCGLQLISTRVGGIAEYFDKQEGVQLIEAGKEEELLNALKNAIESEDTDEKRLSRHQYAKEQFGVEAIGGSINEVYQTVLS